MSTDYSAFEALKLGNINQAIDIWSNLISDSTISRENASAYFNLSTLLLNNFSIEKNIEYDELEQAITLKLRFLESEYANILFKKLGGQEVSIKSEELQISFLELLQAELFSLEDSEVKKFIETIRGLQFIGKDSFLIGLEQSLVKKSETQNNPEDDIKEYSKKEPMKMPIEPDSPLGVGKEGYIPTDEKLGIILMSIFALLFIVIMFTFINSNSRSNREYDALNIENSTDTMGDKFIDTSDISIEMKNIILRYCKATVSNDYEGKLETYGKLTEAGMILLLDETPESINILATKLSNIWKNRLNNLIPNEGDYDNRLDGLARTPKDLFRIFIEKINSGNCEEAFLYQANPAWENVFCSNKGVGRLKDIRLHDVRYMYADDKVSELFINYRAIDNNSETNFLQKVVIEKKLYKGRNLWVVTKIIDLFSSLKIPENTIFYEGIVLRDTQMVIPFVKYTNNSFEHPETMITKNMKNSISNIYYHVNSVPIVFKITNGKVEKSEKVLSFVQNIDYYLNDTTIIESKNIIGITKHVDNSNFYCNNYNLRSNSNTFKPEFEKEHTYYLPDGNSYTVNNEKELLGYMDLNNDGVNEYFYRVIDADGCFYDWHYEIYQYSTHNSWQMVYKSYNYTLRENSNTDFE